MELATFWCRGWCSDQMSYPARTYLYFKSLDNKIFYLISPHRLRNKWEIVSRPGCRTVFMEGHRRTYTHGGLQGYKLSRLIYQLLWLLTTHQSALFQIKSLICHYSSRLRCNIRLENWGTVWKKKRIPQPWGIRKPLPQTARLCRERCLHDNLGHFWESW